MFGVGGLIARLVRRGRRVRLVAVTDGEAAFGAVSDVARRHLAARRAQERDAALDALGAAGSVDVVRLCLPDGAVADHEHTLADELSALAGPVVLATWRHDGHPDHEATGRAAAVAAGGRGARLVEYTVWAAHRHRLTSERLSSTRRVRFVPLAPPDRAAKVRAVAEFRSQLEPSPDGRPVVPAGLVARLRIDDEVLLS